MKSLNASPWIPLILKLVGVLLILTSVIDYLILLSTAKFQDNQWVITFTTQVVDRGFIPLVGIVILFVGLWMEAIGNGSDATRTAPGLRLTALIISSILGLCFLIVVPWHVIATRSEAEVQVKRVAEEASKAETQLNAQVQQVKGLGPQQLDTQLAELEKVINSGQLQGDQLTQAQQKREQLKRLKSNPKALEAEVEAQIAPKRTEELTRIRNRKQELEEQTQGNALRAALRTGLNSLLLAIGYVIIGWTGLRQMLYLRN